MQIPPIGSGPILRFVLMLVLAGGALSRAANVLNGLDDEKVQIVHESSFLESVPERGTLPLTFEIRNAMDKPARWTFRFLSTQGWDRRKQMTSERQVDVPAKSSKTVRWEIPIFPNTEFSNSNQQSLMLTVLGPGSTAYEEQIMYSSANFYNSTNGMRLIAVSPELTITREKWKYSAFQNEINTQNLPLHLAPVNFDSIPDSMIGLSGMDVLLVTQDEWESLSSYHPLFLKWVAGGGQLILVSETPQADRHIGLGTMQEIPFLDPEALIQKLGALPVIQNTLADTSAFTRREWELVDAVPAIKSSFGWVMLSVLVIAGLLGPLNIWSSFRKRNSMQVIWSTPLISLVLSTLVALGIVFSDGFGGKGQRAAWILLVPDQNLELLVQEQVSRTGVLLSRRFSLPQDTEIYRVESDSKRDRASVTYRQLADGGWAGDWFENRSIQAQVLRRDRTSRAEVLFTAGSTPSVLSTVDAHFSRVLIRDKQGNYWSAEQVAPGQETAMKSLRPTQAKKILSELKTRKKSLFPGEQALNQKGWFYAETSEKDRYLETLSSVKWQDRPLWVLGPVRQEERP